MATVFKNVLYTGIGPAINITSVTPAVAITGVSITGTGGQFQCSSTTLSVGQTITITGTFGGSGSITGYATGNVYYIIATNGTTTFTLSASKGGSAITTTSGTPTGLTYINSSVTIGFATQSSAPYLVGLSVNIAGVSVSGFNGSYTVVSCTTSSLVITNSTTTAPTATNGVYGTLSSCALSSNPAASTTAIGLSLTNTTPSIIQASVQLQDTIAGTTAYYINNVTIPPNASLRTINGGEKLILTPSTNVVVTSNTSSSVDCIMSWVEIS